MSATPKVLLTTTEGNILLSEFRGRPDQTFNTTMTDRNVRVLAAEIMPQQYGIVICKYDAAANPPVDPAAPDGTYLSVLMDDAFRFSCKEGLLTVDISLFQFDTGDWTLHYHLAFEDAIDWFDCVRVLSDGKAKHTVFVKRIRANLAVAAAMGFTPEANDGA